MIIAAGRELIESTDTWKKGKTFAGVKTLFHSGDWHCRLSEHPPDQITFQQLWDKMAYDKAPNEKEYASFLAKPIIITTLLPDLFQF